ncbi:hypothetical protein PsorP6_019463 [Peronosclerospora sorghi]|nr:hypothetical protein PsorP6_019463 [Peronosclerospora sorghi]
MQLPLSKTYLAEFLVGAKSGEILVGAVETHFIKFAATFGFSIQFGGCGGDVLKKTHTGQVTK